MRSLLSTTSHRSSPEIDLVLGKGGRQQGISHSVDSRTSTETIPRKALPEVPALNALRATCRQTLHIIDSNIKTLYQRCPVKVVIESDDEEGNVTASISSGKPRFNFDFTSGACTTATVTPIKLRRVHRKMQQAQGKQIFDKEMTKYMRKEFVELQMQQTFEKLSMRSGGIHLIIKKRTRLTCEFLAAIQPVLGITITLEMCCDYSLNEIPRNILQQQLFASERNLIMHADNESSNRIIDDQFCREMASFSVLELHGMPLSRADLNTLLSRTDLIRINISGNCCISLDDIRWTVQELLNTDVKYYFNFQSKYPHNTMGYDAMLSKQLEDEIIKFKTDKNDNIYYLYSNGVRRVTVTTHLSTIRIDAATQH